VRESVHRRCICEVRELVLRLYMYVAHESAAHHHDGRVVHVLAHHRCTCAERELEPRLYMNAERELVLHLYMHVAHESVRHRCTYAGRELVLRLYGNDLLVRHRDGRAVRESELRRCICEVRELGGLLHCDREFHLAFRHPCAVVFRKDSKRHYCALLRVLRRAVIQRGCEHLDREVRVVHGIRLLPP
jgi:PAS domain-containing protein